MLQKTLGEYSEKKTQERKDNIELLKGFLSKDFSVDMNLPSDSMSSLNKSYGKKSKRSLKPNLAKFITSEDDLGSEIKSSSFEDDLIIEAKKYGESFFDSKQKVIFCITQMCGMGYSNTGSRKDFISSEPNFVPSIDPISEKLAKGKSITKKGRDVWEHLHNLGREHKEKFDQNHLENERKKEQKDLEKCTFQPEIKNNNPSCREEDGIYKRSQIWKEVIEEK